MDGSRFDAWTRRRFGGVVAGALATALGLAIDPVDPAAAADRKPRKKRQRRRKKRISSHACEPHGTSCNPRNERRLCCAPNACGQVLELGGYHCCTRRFQPCDVNHDCCNNLVCVDGLCDISL
ncbi:MAG: hypothetical protein QM692_20640 [Thermomicrobiales bacterium]